MRRYVRIRVEWCESRPHQKVKVLQSISIPFFVKEFDFGEALEKFCEAMGVPKAPYLKKYKAKEVWK